jgi:hypothetical protein
MTDLARQATGSALHRGGGARLRREPVEPARADALAASTWRAPPLAAAR